MSDALFGAGETVLHRSTNDIGVVRGPAEKIAGEYWYQVRFANRTDNLPEEDLDRLAEEEESLQSLAEAGKWGQLDAVRCALAIERILHTNRSTIYAFQNQRILFQPYQYKPLLKILDSPDRRLLIADEVGLGKTIEAGLILTELNARKSLESVMIVCPSRLREKWRNELNRKFDEDFEIFDRRSFEQTARRFNDRPGRVRIRGIMSVQAMRSRAVREILTGVLGTLDLVIMDEAHHARNPNTATSGVLRDLCEIADSMVLLTATPIQLDNRDLFTLVSALRPTEFRDAWTFDRLLNGHANVHVASSLARRQDRDCLPEIQNILRLVFIEGRRQESIDPLAMQLIEELTTAPPETRSDWINVERRIHDLHPLGTILTRTKKRDVLENAPLRVAHPYLCDWTSEEDEAYQRLIDSSGSHGWPSSSLSFGQIQRARQAASCLPAAWESQVLGKTDDDSTELTDIMPSELKRREAEEKPTPVDLGRWAGPDSKYVKFQEILDKVWENNAASKILVFTFFKGTARYLERRLSATGVKVLRIDGDVLSDPRQPDKDERGKRLLQFEKDPEIQVMVSTEVGSEGLDFQFCHHLVNYDLPWNPMVVEQRIGRIDRFGQKSEKVYIHNLVVAGTVEDRILQRLYNRIGIFERSIGALEAIIGDTMQTLQRDYLNGVLTEEEAEQRVEQAANAIEQRNKHLEALEQNASQLFGHEEYVREELNRVRNLGHFVSEASLLAILRTYFRTCHPAVKIATEGEGVFGIKLTDDLRMDVQSAARKMKTLWTDRSTGGILRFTTSGEKAFEHADLELINATHPLIRAATQKLAAQMEAPTARLGAARIVVSPPDSGALEPGDYFLVMAPQQVHGIRNRRLIETIVMRVADGHILPADLSQRLLYLVVEHGEDWARADAPQMPESSWKEMRSELLRRTGELKRREKGENEALYVRQRNARIAEHEHNLEQKKRRLNTSRRRGNEGGAKLFEGQIAKELSRHQDVLASLDENQAVSVVSGDPVAACVIQVSHSIEAVIHAKDQIAATV